MSKFDVSQKTNLTLDKKTRRYMCKKRGFRFFAVLGSESSQLTSRRAAQGHVKWPGARRETERDGGRNLQEKFKGACDVWTANVLPEVVAWSVCSCHPLILMVMPEMQPQRSDVRLGPL